MTVSSTRRQTMLRTAVIALLVACGPGESDRIKSAREVDKEQTPENLFITGKNFAAVGDTTRAEQYLSASMERGADPAKVLPLLLEVCVRDGRFEMAIEYAKPYLVQHPNDAHVRYLLATLYSAVGDGQHAHEEANNVVNARPNDPDPHFLFGTVLREEKDLVGADKQFREYLRIAPHGAHADEARAALLKEVPPPSNTPWDGGIPTPIGPIPDSTPPTTIADSGAMMSPEAGRRKEGP
jgi:predicted Zn-dependent protease